MSRIIRTAIDSTEAQIGVVQALGRHCVSLQPDSAWLARLSVALSFASSVLAAPPGDTPTVAQSGRTAAGQPVRRRRKPEPRGPWPASRSALRPGPTAETGMPGDVCFERRQRPR